MTIFGFQLWSNADREHVQSGTRRIGDALHGIADDLEAARQLNRERMGLDAPPSRILPTRKIKESVK